MIGLDYGEASVQMLPPDLEPRHRQGEPIRMRDAGSAAIDVAIGVSAFRLVKAI